MKKAFIHSLFALITFILTILILSGCTTPYQDSRPTGNIITGTITAEDIILFPPQLVVKILLTNEQAADGEPGEIAKQIIKNPQVNPIKFSLRYDREDIIEYKTYEIHVYVYNKNNDLLYTSLKGSPVITHNNSDKVVITLVSP